jgi:hypothetical protein
MKTNSKAKYTTSITWDGFGINDTYQYGSRIAKFQPEYLHLGPKIVRAVNSQEVLLETLKNIEYKLVKGFRYVKEIDPSARINFADALSLVTQTRLQMGEK